MENKSKLSFQNEQIDLKLTELDIVSMTSIKPVSNQHNQIQQRNNSNSVSLTYTLSLQQIPIQIKSQNINQRVNSNSVNDVYNKKQSTKFINIKFYEPNEGSQTKFRKKFIKNNNRVSKILKASCQDPPKTIQSVQKHQPKEFLNNLRNSQSTNVGKGFEQKIGINLGFNQSYRAAELNNRIKERKIYRKSNFHRKEQKKGEFSEISKDKRNKISLSEKKLLQFNVLSSKNIAPNHEIKFSKPKFKQNLISPEFATIGHNRTKINSERIYLQAAKYQQIKNKLILKNRKSEHQSSKLRDTIQVEFKNLLISSNHKLLAVESGIGNKKLLYQSQKSTNRLNLVK